MKAKFINEALDSSVVGFIEEYGELVSRRHKAENVQQLLNDYGISKLDLLELAASLKDMYGASFESEWRSPDSREGMIYNHPNLIEPRGLKSYAKSDGPEGGLYYNDAIEKWI